MAVPIAPGALYLDMEPTRLALFDIARSIVVGSLAEQSVKDEALTLCGKVRTRLEDPSGFDPSILSRELTDICEFLGDSVGDGLSAFTVGTPPVAATATPVFKFLLLTVSCDHIHQISSEDTRL